MDTAGVVRYPHTDRRGSTIAVSQAGKAVERFHYGEFGQSGPTITGYPYRYTGQRLDAWTGLYNYKAREYAPSIGRFLQPDPLGFVDGPNVYAYVGNNPLNRTDPTGKYGRGSGFTARQWANFDAAQRRAAADIRNTMGALEGAASELEGGGDLSRGARQAIWTFESVMGEGQATTDNLRAAASALGTALAALEGTEAQGYVANGYQTREWRALPFQLSDDAAAAGAIDQGRMFVYVDHPAWGSQRANFLAPIIGHEALHNAGYHDQSNSELTTAYRNSTQEQRSLYRALRGAPRALVNPDHLMALVY